jgi:hypothetical protein
MGLLGSVKHLREPMAAWRRPCLWQAALERLDTGVLPSAPSETSKLDRRFWVKDK